MHSAFRHGSTANGAFGTGSAPSSLGGRALQLADYRRRNTRVVSRGDRRCARFDMTLPNCIVIGQMKAGTSSLHAYLRQHPDIFMPSVKELRFFSEVISESGDRLLVDEDYKRKRIMRGMPVTFDEYE